jgi:hypothetical protein
MRNYKINRQLWLNSPWLTDGGVFLAADDVLLLTRFSKGIDQVTVGLLTSSRAG